MMDRRIGLRVGGALAVVTCALLVACGGGGGGGGSTLPSTGSSGGGSTPTPLPATQTASATTSTTASTTLTLGAILSGPTSTLVSFPAASAVTTATVTEQSTLPSGSPIAPQSRVMKHPATLGSTPTVLAYYVLSVNPTVTISSAPGFTLALSSALATSGYADVVFYTGATNGWVSLEEIPATAGATSLTFPQAAISPSATLTAGTSYVFAVVTSAKQLITPSPSPTSSASTAPTSGPTSGPTLAPGTAPTLPPGPATLSSHGWGAADVANAYGFPVQSGYNGQGQTIAIIGDATPSPTDISGYLSGYGIVAPIYTGTYNVVPVDAGPGVDPSGQGEATLDVETVSGLAPGANVLFYGIPDLSDLSFVDGYNKVLTDGKAKVLSISFGGCEGYAGQNYTTADSPVLANLANAGIAIVASSGDQGNECYVGMPSPGPQFTPGANYPASDPSVIGVGGTQTDTAVTSTAVWNDANGSGGGGVSQYFSIPTAQVGLGLSSSTMRNVPDVAMPGVFVSVHLGNKWQSFDGTSWSAPQTAAMLAEIDEYCGGPIPTSFSAPQDLFYKAYGRSAAAFTDITQGNNQYQSTTPFYAAAVGPDDVSGLGAPNGVKIAQTLCPNHVPQIARAYGASYVPMGYGASRDLVLDNVPHVPGLRDLGVRNASVATRIAIVLRSNASLASDLQTVASALRSAGFTVDSATGMVVDAHAPASVVASYFGTDIHDYDQGGAGMRYANARAVTVPAAIAPYVSGVVADNLIVGRHFLYPHRR